MVTGPGPQEKVMTPPAATARTTAREVQLPGVPSPTTRVGREVSTGRASGGTAARPRGFPGPGASAAPACDDPSRGEPACAEPVDGGAAAAGGWPIHAHAETVIPDTTGTRSALRRNRMGRG
ncbi:hypothetical protein Plo01_75400 [Planobispora longispora]|uniref:Uncharacterized protein n=1 Tax=Planobispora longispora TaxID=28887 RepID=A0A8J3RVY1_9ACTN|nr:hypothetical protein Plo01_75400 [Planobispora longispora]